MPAAVLQTRDRAEATFTENGDLTNASSLDACVDFFYIVHDVSSKEEVRTLLAAAWQACPEDALKLVFYLLDIRNGKGCTGPALHALTWLFQEHPQTLLANLRQIEVFGCIRDYSTLLMLVRSTSDDEMDFNAWIRDPRGFDRASIYRKIRTVALSGASLSLHESIVQLFVEALTQDRLCLTQQRPVSLFSKWLPSQDSYLNRSTRLFDDVAMMLYRRDHEHCSTRRPLIHARNHLRKSYISPLRAHVRIVERMISDGDWDQVVYPFVPSKCMARNAPSFLKHDRARYESFLADAWTGKAQINAATLKPHEICFPPQRFRGLPSILVNAQWESYIARMKTHGALRKAVAVCDVSGSMAGRPLEVAVSLSLLLAEVTEIPWKGHLITFSDRPEFHVVTGDDLAHKLNSVMSMNVGYNTDFDLVFDIILQRALDFALGPEDMPDTLFVFSDMQFDQADPNMSSTAFQRVEEKFSRAGYARPNVVFWNLQASHGIPVQITDEGTALVSGFSGNLLKLFLEGQDLGAAEGATQTERPSPVDVMRKALDHERFHDLVVKD